MANDLKFLTVVGDNPNRHGYVGIGPITSNDIIERLTVSGSIKQLGDKTSIYNNNYISGFFGTGYSLKQESDGSFLQVDNLMVRNALYASIFQIDTIRASNGYLFISDCAQLTEDVVFENYTKSEAVPLNNNTFQKGDLLWYKSKDSDYNITAIKCQVTSNCSTQSDSDNGQTYYVYQIKSFSGLGTMQAGKTLVRVGNITNSSRQGSIYFAANGNNTPYMDIYNDVNSFTRSGDSDSFSFASAEKLKVRLGKLDGVTDNTISTNITGYGLYSDNVFLKGAIVASSGKIGGWSINSDSLFATSSSTTTGAKIYIGSGTYSNSNTPFYVDDTGKFSLKNKLYFSGDTLTIDGTVTASSGKIGGWTIGATSIYSGSNSFDNSNSMYFGTSGLSIKNTFKVTNGGVLTATSGTIGGWNLAADKIYSSSNPNNSGYTQSGVMYFGTSGLSLGTTFNVTNTGIITASSGKIGGWNLSSNSIYSGSNSLNNSNSMYFGINGLNLKNKLVFDSTNNTLTIDGTITSSAGSIGGWKLSSNSIYSTSNANSSYNEAGVMYFGTSGLSLSDKFSVTPQGALTASSGKIGGWDIGTTALSSGIVSITSAGSGNGWGDVIVTGTPTPLNFYPNSTTSTIIAGPPLGSTSIEHSLSQTISTSNYTNGISITLQHIITQRPITTGTSIREHLQVLFQIYQTGTGGFGRSIPLQKSKSFGKPLSTSIVLQPDDYSTTKPLNFRLIIVSDDLTNVSSRIEINQLTAKVSAIPNPIVQLSPNGLFIYNNPQEYIKIGATNRDSSGNGSGDSTRFAQMSLDQLTVKRLTVLDSLLSDASLHVSTQIAGTTADIFTINTDNTNISPTLRFNRTSVTDYLDIIADSSTSFTFKAGSTGQGQVTLKNVVWGGDNINLGSQVTGILPISKGGTGLNTIAANKILFSTANGLTATDISNIVTTRSNNPNGLMVTASGGTQSFYLSQNLTTTGSPTFAGLTVGGNSVVTTARTLTLTTGSGTGAGITISNNAAAQNLSSNRSWTISHVVYDGTSTTNNTKTSFVNSLSLTNGHVDSYTTTSKLFTLGTTTFNINDNLSIIGNGIISTTTGSNSTTKSVTISATPKKLSIGDGLTGGTYTNYDGLTDVTISHTSFTHIPTGSITSNVQYLSAIGVGSNGHITSSTYSNLFSKFTASAPLSYTNSSGVNGVATFGLNYSSTNLKLTGTNLDTIQNITTTSSPQFKELILKNTVSNSTSSTISVATDGGFQFSSSYIKLIKSSNQYLKQQIDNSGNIVFIINTNTA